MTVITKLLACPIDQWHQVITGLTAKDAMEVLRETDATAIVYAEMSACLDLVSQGIEKPSSNDVEMVTKQRRAKMRKLLGYTYPQQ